MEAGKTSSLPRVCDNDYNNYDDDYVTLEVTTWSAALLRHGTESSPRQARQATRSGRLRIIYASGCPNARQFNGPEHSYTQQSLRSSNGRSHLSIYVSTIIASHRGE